VPSRDAEAKIKFPLFIPLAAAHDQEVVGPRQNSHRWCEFWKAAIRFVKLHHPPEIAGGKSAGIGPACADVFGQGRNGSLSPSLLGDLPTDVLADSPIQVDQRGIDVGDNAGAGSFDQREDLVEPCR
jgi:hypothetical protein